MHHRPPVIHTIMGSFSRVRRLGSLAGSALLFVACNSATTSGPSGPRRSVAQENSRQGDPSWYVLPSQWAPQAQLAAWASPYAARFGDNIDLFIHATNGPVNVRVYRLGWYRGAGGRLFAQQPKVSAAAQPSCTPPFPGPVRCPWSVTTRVAIGNDWVSGLYLVRIDDATGRTAYAPFVLTDTRPAPFIGIVPQFTWQAYNKYGGSSLYTPGAGDSSEAQLGAFAHFVSFERPFGTGGGGSLVFADFKSHDLRDIRFLERNGYDLTYASDLDLTSAGRGVPHPTNGLVFLGHDEYWTYGERSTVERMRDAHTHLAFLSGNIGYWNIRLSSGTVTSRSGHEITCYKFDADPGATADTEVTTLFRLPPLNRPENSLVGVEYVVGTQTTPLQALVVSDTSVGAEASAFLQAASLHPGDALRNQVAVEGDRIIPPGTPAGLQVIFRSPIVPKFHVPYAPFYYTTFYVAHSGAGVFAAGDVEYGRGLDAFHGTAENPGLEALTKAVLDWMLSH